MKSSQGFNYKKIAYLIIIGMIIAWILFPSSTDVNEETVRMGRDALRMLDVAQAERRNTEIIESFLMGIGYIFSLALPAGVVVYLLHTLRKH